MLARLVLVSMLLAVMGICTADDKKDEKKKDEKHLLEGKWEVVDSTIPQQIGKMLTVKGDEWTSPMGIKFTTTIDDSKKPKQLDLTRAKDAKFLGIYKVEDDKLTFCREKVARGVRPQEFKATESNDLLVLKRVSQSSPSPGKKPMSVDDPGKNGITGTWKAEDVAFAPWKFTLKADGSKLTGTVSQGSTNGSESTSLTGDTPIYDGTIDGNKVSFKCNAPGGGRTISFSGVTKGDTVTFTREVKVEPGASPGRNGIYGATGAAKFTASRVSASVKAPPGATGAESARMPVAELPVPSIKDVPRVDRGTPPSQQNAITATFILKTSPHATLGDGYVIVTDQTQPAFLEPIERLAKFHHGSIINVKDLGSLRTDAEGRDQLVADLRRAKPHFVAVAPKLLTEKVLLGFWCVLAMLGDDQRLPVCPGILAAPNAAAFKSLVDRSINYHPQAEAEVRPFVIGQVLSPMPYGQRSLQKVRMMRNLFADYDCTTHSLVTLAYSAASSGVTVAPASNQWQAAMSGPAEFVKGVPAEARPSLDAASLLLMFGHGNLGNACSLDVRAFQDVKMTGKVVMSGNCFSAAAPAKSGKPASGEGRNAALSPPEGESFAMRAVENGAVVVYAHMAENAGFPHLFPVLETWMDGLPVGEAYERLVNALIGFEHITVADLGSRDAERLNSLLYVIIGDPALQPLAKMTPHTGRRPAPSRRRKKYPRNRLFRFSAIKLARTVGLRLASTACASGK